MLVTRLSPKDPWVSLTSSATTRFAEGSSPPAACYIHSPCYPLRVFILLVRDVLEKTNTQFTHCWGLFCTPGTQHDVACCDVMMSQSERSALAPAVAAASNGTFPSPPTWGTKGMRGLLQEHPSDFTPAGTKDTQATAVFPLLPNSGSEGSVQILLEMYGTWPKGGCSLPTSCCSNCSDDFMDGPASNTD